jgi:DASH complex subunit DAD1
LINEREAEDVNMATNRAQATNGTHAAPEKSYYEQQREMLVTEIAQVC